MARPRLARIGRIVLRFGLGLLLLVLLAPVLVLAFLATPFGRDFTRVRVNGLLAEQFLGTLVIHRLGGVGLSGVEGADIGVWDQRGRPVLGARGCRVDADVLSIAKAFVTQRGSEVRIELGVLCDHVEARLVDDGSGAPTLASAFSPRTPSPPTASGESPTIVLAPLRLQHVWIHGRLSDFALDLDVSELDAALKSDQDLDLGIHGARVVARSLPTVRETRAFLTGSVRSTAKSPDVHISAELSGNTLDSDYFIAAALAGKRLGASVLVPSVSANTLRTVVPTLAFEHPPLLSASVGGSTDALWFDAALTGPDGSVTANGTLTTAERTTLAAKVWARRIELSKLVAGAPEASVTLDGSVSLDLDDALKGVYRVDASGSTVLGERLTQAKLNGELRTLDGGHLTLAGELELCAQGLDSTVTYSVLSGRATRVRAELDARLEEPALLARPTSLFASGTLQADLEYLPDAEQIAATAKTRLTRLRIPGSLEATSLNVDARASGAVGSPELEAKVDVAKVAAGERTLEDVVVSALGTLKQLQVRGSAQERGRPIRFDGRVDLEDGVDVVRANLAHGEGDSALRASVERATVRGGAVTVKGLSLTGAGSLRADFTLRDTLDSLRVESDALDISRLAREAGVELPVRDVKLTVTAEYSRAKRAGFARGTARAVAERARSTAAPARRRRSLPLELVLDLATRDGVLSGTAQIDAENVSLRLDAQDVLTSSIANIGVRPLGLRGSVRLSGDMNLRDLSQSGLLALAGIERASGKLGLDVYMPDAQEREAPALVVHVRSKGLELVGQREALPQSETVEQAERAEPWVVRGVDVDATLGVAFQERRAGLSARLFDTRGTLLDARVESELPANLFVNGLGLDAMLDAATRATVTVPKRRLDRLPPQLRPATLEGALSAHLTAEGTPRRPEIAGHVEVSGLRTVSAEHADERADDPIDSALDFEYRPDGGALELLASVRRKPVLRASTKWVGDAAKVPAALSAGAPSPISGGLALEFTQFPLTAMRLVRTQTIRGALDGKLAVEDFGRAPKVNGELKARGFAVGAVEPGDATFGVKLEGRELSANAELVAKKGSAKLAWQASVDWGAQVAPSAVVSRSVEAKLRRFDLATLFPLVEGDVSELAGKVDADARMVDTKNGRDLRAQVVLSDGVLQIPAIGQRFHDIEARATLANDDIRLTQFKARGLTGALTVSGRAKLREFELVEANARVQIAEKEMIPVTLEGVSLGDAWGDAELRFARSADGTMALEAKLEKLHVVLPETAPSSVQNFEPAAHVNIGVVRRDGAFAAIPLQPIQSETNGGAGAATLLRVTLGNDVWVHQGEKLHARFRGGLAARLGEKQDFEGKIELAGGMLDVSGKRFEIETGTITFAGPVEEALITATARWDSPAGYAVYANFSGSVSDGKISLRSEPPLGNDEVLSLLLFGTPDGSVGGGSGDEASTAASIAGDTAAAGLNQLIGRFTNLDVSARVDTSTGSARPEIVVQLTPRLTARVTRALGEPPPGQSPDRTFFTLELRLKRRWSIATIVGDHGGTALEIVWRLRY